MSSTPRRKATLLSIPAMALLAVACSSGGALPSSSGGPSTSAPPAASPSVTPDADAIAHPTGATDVVLRYDELGGFVMASFAATMVPPFTMYGDGTIVFRDPTLEYPPVEGSVGKANPMRTAKLTEEQIQDVLKLALGEGGLATAKPEYRNDMVADAGTAVFTIDAGGVEKTVSVYALGIDPQAGSPDAAARAGFAKLAQALTGIEKGGVITATDYEPAAYRGVLIDSGGMQAPDARPWPWDDIEPTDFQPDADPNGLQIPHLTLTSAQVEALGITDYAGGLQNVPLTGSDGGAYTLSVRPLLPDEAS